MEITEKLLQESNLGERQPRRAPHQVIQAITGEGLAQGPYIVASGFEPPTFLTGGITTPPISQHAPIEYDFVFYFRLANSYMYFLALGLYRPIVPYCKS